MITKETKGWPQLLHRLTPYHNRPSATLNPDGTSLTHDTCEDTYNMVTLLRHQLNWVKGTRLRINEGLVAHVLQRLPPGVFLRGVLQRARSLPFCAATDADSHRQWAAHRLMTKEGNPRRSRYGNRSLPNRLCWNWTSMMNTQSIAPPPFPATSIWHFSQEDLCRSRLLTL